MSAISDGVDWGDAKIPEPVDMLALKDSVAAHQAECFCHLACGDCNDEPGPLCPIGYAGKLGKWARDSSGQPWHIDPLCKVRPEAKA